MAKLIETLRESADRTGSIACFGNDPVLGEGKIHLPGTFLEASVPYMTAIFQEMRKRGVKLGALKPNQGFYVMHDRPFEGDFGGSLALVEVMKLCKEEEVPTILDFKRGDIKKSSANYAAEGFDAWQADSVTIHPYMAEDSVAPFFEKGGAFLMCRTSNPSSDIQNLTAIDFSKFDPKTGMGSIDMAPVYMRVAELAVKWSKNPKYAGNVGVVLGATHPGELESVVRFFAEENAEIGLLIPGVGAQGGSAEECMERMAAAGYDHRLARINSSSGLCFAYAKRGRPAEEWAEASVDAIADLNKEINLQKYTKSA